MDGAILVEDMRQLSESHTAMRITLETGDTASKTPGAVLLKGNLSDIAKSKL